MRYLIDLSKMVGIIGANTMIGAVMTETRRELQIDRYKLAECMQRSTLNQTQLAERVGVDQAVISRLVRGRQAGVNMRTLFALARELNVAPAELIIDPGTYDLGLSAALSPLSDEEKILALLRQRPELIAGLAELSGSRPSLILNVLGALVDEERGQK